MRFMVTNCAAFYFVVLFSSVACFAASERNCEKSFRTKQTLNTVFQRNQKIIHSARRLAAKGSYGLASIVFYPLTAPVEIVYRSVVAYKKKEKSYSRSLGKIATSVVFKSAIGILIAHLAWANIEGRSVDTLDVYELSSELVSNSEERDLYIDGISTSDKWLANRGRNEFQFIYQADLPEEIKLDHLYNVGKNDYFRPSSISSLLQKLVQLAVQKRKYRQIIINCHGSSGRLYLNGKKIDIETIENFPDLEGLVVERGVISILSCLVCSYDTRTETNGELFVEAIGKKLLGAKGGFVVGTYNIAMSYPLPGQGSDRALEYNNFRSIYWDYSMQTARYLYWLTPLIDKTKTADYLIVDIPSKDSPEKSKFHRYFRND